MVSMNELSQNCLHLVEYLHLHEILYQFSNPLDEENVNELAESQLQNKLDDQSPPTEDTIKQGKKNINPCKIQNRIHLKYKNEQLN